MYQTYVQFQLTVNLTQFLIDRAVTFYDGLQNKIRGVL